MISRGDISLRHHKHEYDTRKLGRWASQAFQGKNGLVTRFVSVYVPIVARDHGEKKVAIQQQQALLSLGVKEHFLRVFWQDFWEQVDLWLDQEDQLIVSGDWNQDIHIPKFQEPFLKRNLIPAVHS